MYMQIMLSVILFYHLGETPFFYFKRKQITNIYIKLGEISDMNNSLVKTKIIKSEILN